MKFKQWIRPGLGIKRWVVQIIIGLFMGSYAVINLVSSRGQNSMLPANITLLVIGIAITVWGIKKYTVGIMEILRMKAFDFSMDDKAGNEEFLEKNILMRGPKIAAIGGGTGLSNMLSGLKRYTSNITAVVTVADDGGGSGVLRQDLGILPPGDIRSCIIALADTEPLMEQLFRYRFTDGKLENQSFGNLFLAAMSGISDNFLEAVKKTSDVLKVTGKVLPVTLDNVELYAKLKNGDIIKGESSIPKESISRKSEIDRVFIEPKNAKAVDEAVSAIMEADAVVIGPGSLYTSIIPNLMVEDIKKAIIETKAVKIYVSNIITQYGESDNFSVQDHIKKIKQHCEGIKIDYAIVNECSDEKYRDIQGMFDDELHFVELDKLDKKHEETEYIKGDFLKIKRQCVRHDEKSLARILMDTIMQKDIARDERKIVEYVYLLQKIRKEDKDRE